MGPGNQEAKLTIRPIQIKIFFTNHSSLHPLEPVAVAVARIKRQAKVSSLGRC